MSWIYYNPNPIENLVGNCVIRAITIAIGENWDKTYLAISSKGYEIKDMPSSNKTWGAFLRQRGFKRYIIPNECPDCYTIEDFCRDNPRGTYILATGTHVVACVDGNYYDTWDSGKKVPLYYFKKEG